MQQCCVVTAPVNSNREPGHKSSSSWSPCWPAPALPHTEPLHISCTVVKWHSHTDTLLYILIKPSLCAVTAQRKDWNTEAFQFLKFWNFAAVGRLYSRTAAIVVKWPQRAASSLAGNEWTVNLQQCWEQRKRLPRFSPFAWLNASCRCRVIGWVAVAIGM